MTKCAFLSACAIALTHTIICSPVVGADEISSGRAWDLAQIYYMRYLGGCGGVGAVLSRQDHWLAPVRFGYAGTFRGYIRVNRHTGAVSYSSHPTVSAQTLDSWFASVTK